MIRLYKYVEADSPLFQKMIRHLLKPGDRAIFDSIVGYLSLLLLPKRILLFCYYKERLQYQAGNTGTNFYCSSSWLFAAPQKKLLNLLGTPYWYGCPWLKWCDLICLQWKEDDIQYYFYKKPWIGCQGNKATKNTLSSCFISLCSGLYYCLVINN